MKLCSDFFCFWLFFGGGEVWVWMDEGEYKGRGDICCANIKREKGVHVPKSTSVLVHTTVVLVTVGQALTFGSVTVNGCGSGALLSNPLSLSNLCLRSSRYVSKENLWIARSLTNRNLPDGFFDPGTFGMDAAGPTVGWILHVGSWVEARVGSLQDAVTTWVALEMERETLVFVTVNGVVVMVVRTREGVLVTARELA